MKRGITRGSGLQPCRGRRRRRGRPARQRRGDGVCDKTGRRALGGLRTTRHEGGDEADDARRERGPARNVDNHAGTSVLPFPGPWAGRRGGIPGAPRWRLGRCRLKQGDAQKEDVSPLAAPLPLPAPISNSALSVAIPGPHQGPHRHAPRPRRRFPRADGGAATGRLCCWPLTSLNARHLVFIASL